MTKNKPTSLHEALTHIDPGKADDIMGKYNAVMDGVSRSLIDGGPELNTATASMEELNHLTDELIELDEQSVSSAELQAKKSALLEKLDYQLDQISAKLSLQSKETKSVDFLSNAVSTGGYLKNEAINVYTMFNKLEQSIKGDRLHTSFLSEASGLRDLYINWQQEYALHKSSVLAYFGDHTGSYPDELKTVFEEIGQYSMHLEDFNRLLESAVSFSEIENNFLTFVNGINSKGTADPMALPEESAVVYLELRRYKTRFASVGELSNNVEFLRSKHIAFIDWNLASAPESIMDSQTEYLSKEELVSLVQKLGQDQFVLAPEAFDEQLTWILSNILYIPKEKKQVHLPDDYTFYESLITLVEGRFSAETGLTKAHSLMVLSQLKVLKAKAEHAIYYKAGYIIWNYYYESSDGGIKDPDATDYPMEHGGGSNQAEQYTKRGIIAEVDFINESLKFKGESEWIPFETFENNSYRFGDEDRPGNKPIGDEIASSGHRIAYNSAKETMFEAQAVGCPVAIKQLNEDVKVYENHIPRYSLLRKYIEKGWVKLDTKGGIEMVNGFPKEYTMAIYKEIMKQFGIEQIYDAKTKLEKASPEMIANDKYYEARKVFMTSQVDLASEDIYAARGHLMQFLKMIKGINAEMDEGIKSAREFAIITLKGFALRSLSRILEMAGHLFGFKEEYKDFYKGVAEKVVAEINRIEGANVDDPSTLDETIFDIKPAALHLDCWSVDTKADTGIVNGDKIIFDKAYKYGFEKAGLRYDPLAISKSPFKWPVISANTTSAAAEGRQARKFKKAYGYIQEYMEKYHPTDGIINTWNKLIKFESPENYENLIDPDKRSQAFLDMGKALRSVKSEKWVPGVDRLFWIGPAVNNPNQKYKLVEEESSIHPEAAHYYLKESMGQEVADAEFKMMEVRQQLKEQEKKFNREKYLGEAKQYLSKMLYSDEMESQLVGSGLLQRDNLLELRKQLSDDKILTMLSEQFVDSFIDAKIQEKIYADFGQGTLKGTKAQEAWEIVNDMLDQNNETWNLSDRNADLAGKIAKELLIFAAITIASMGVASLATGAFRLGWLALNTTRAFGATRIGGLAFKGASFATTVTSFTVAEKSMRSLFLGQNTWGTFGKDLGLNALMFGSVAAGGWLWQKVAGRYLIGTVEAGVLTPSNLYAGAGNLGKTGLRLANFGGTVGMETTIFTGFGLAEQMLLENVDWKDIDVWSQAGMNLVTVLCLKAGDKIFSPLWKPIVGKMELRVQRISEDGNHSLFLKNSALEDGYLKQYTALIPKPGEGASPEEIKAYEARVFEAEQAAIENYRGFIDRFGLPAGFFKGKSPAEISKIMKAVLDVVPNQGKLSEPPSSDVLADLAVKDPATFQIVTNKMSEIPLTTDQIRLIAKTPNGQRLLRGIADKLPISKSALEAMFKPTKSESQGPSAEVATTAKATPTTEAVTKADVDTEMTRLKSKLDIQLNPDGSITVNSPDQTFALMEKLEANKWDFEDTKTGLIATKGDVKLTINVPAKVKAEILANAKAQAKLEATLQKQRQELQELQQQLQKKPTPALIRRAQLAYAKIITTLGTLLYASPALASTGDVGSGSKDLWEGFSKGLGNLLSGTGRAAGGVGEAANDAGNALYSLGTGLGVAIDVFALVYTGIKTHETIRGVAQAFKRSGWGVFGLGWGRGGNMGRGSAIVTQLTAMLENLAPQTPNQNLAVTGTLQPVVTNMRSRPGTLQRDIDTREAGNRLFALLNALRLDPSFDFSSIRGSITELEQIGTNMLNMLNGTVPFDQPIFDGYVQRHGELITQIETINNARRRIAQTVQTFRGTLTALSGRLNNGEFLPAPLEPTTQQFVTTGNALLGILDGTVPFNQTVFDVSYQTFLQSVRNFNQAIANPANVANYTYAQRLNAFNLALTASLMTLFFFLIRRHFLTNLGQTSVPSGIGVQGGGGTTIPGVDVNATTLPQADTTGQTNPTLQGTPNPNAGTTQPNPNAGTTQTNPNAGTTQPNPSSKVKVKAPIIK